MPNWRSTSNLCRTRFGTIENSLRNSRQFCPGESTSVPCASSLRFRIGLPQLAQLDRQCNTSLNQSSPKDNTHVAGRSGRCSVHKSAMHFTSLGFELREFRETRALLSSFSNVPALCPIWGTFTLEKDTPFTAASLSVGKARKGLLSRHASTVSRAGVWSSHVSASKSSVIERQVRANIILEGFTSEKTLDRAGVQVARRCHFAPSHLLRNATFVFVVSHDDPFNCSNGNTSFLLAFFLLSWLLLPLRTVVRSCICHVLHLDFILQKPANTHTRFGLMEGKQAPAGMSLEDIDAQEAAMNREVMGLDIANELSGELDINMAEIDFSEVDDDLKKFQEDEIVKDALQRGVDLGNYARQIESQLRGTEKDSVGDYMKNSTDVADLHLSIKSCDSVLERMEHMLTKFQDDLGKVSSEIKHLQDKSMTMRVKLKNRKTVHKDLDTYVKRIYVSPSLIQSIYEAEIKDQYISNLQELDEKIQYLNRLGKEGRLDKAAKDMVPLCQRAQVKAVSRIRDFLLKKIYLLKKPQTNIQIKQNLLLRFKYLYIFCRKHAPTTAEEIQTVYIDTIKKIYTSHFKLYLNSLMKLRASSVVTKGDLLGLDEAKSGGMFSLRKSKLHLERVFMLGRNRDAILSNIDKPPIIYHTAAKRGHKFPYQEIFRTTHRLLMDTATTETAFIADFFTDSDAKISGVGGDARWAAKQEMILFESIFNKTTSLFIENLEQYLSKTYDCLELLILVRVVSLHTQMMRQRQTECLDMFFDRINMLLWPRFKVVLDSHLASIKNIRTNSVVSRGDMSPFFLSPRYAEFASGSKCMLSCDITNQMCAQIVMIVMILKDDDVDVGRIREAVGKLLETLAVRVGSDSKRTEIVFLINNYDTILKVFDDKNLESETAKSFKEKLHNQVAKYVEMELRNCFSKLIEFVRSSEQKVAEAVDKKIKMPTLDLETGAEIVRSFRQGWQNKVAQIDLHVNSDFSSRNTGHEGTGKASEILKQILIQLVLYYQRLQEVVKKCYRRSPSFMKDLVPIPTIMHEIKKYGSSRMELLYFLTAIPCHY
eukprot:jgi/Bigna1/65988/fgenesh1_pg.1_\